MEFNKIRSEGIHTLYPYILIRGSYVVSYINSYAEVIATLQAVKSAMLSFVQLFTWQNNIKAN